MSAGIEDGDHGEARRWSSSAAPLHVAARDGSVDPWRALFRSVSVRDVPEILFGFQLLPAAPTVARITGSCVRFRVGDYHPCL
jgi:hypothetical protein